MKRLALLILLGCQETATDLTGIDRLSQQCLAECTAYAREQLDRVQSLCLDCGRYCDHACASQGKATLWLCDFFMEQVRQNFQCLDHIPPMPDAVPP